MRVECPNCWRIHAIREKRIVTSRNALEISCPNCKFSMALGLQNTARPEAGRKQALGLSEESLNASDGTDADAKSAPGLAARKAKILRGLVNLPPMPHIILKAREIIADPNSSLKDLASVIETDQAIVAKVLTLANSAYYGVSGMVSSIQHASVLLGQKALAELITISASSSLLSKKLKGYAAAPDEIWKHSLGCAFAAKRIAELVDSGLVEDAFIAGLLHDAGKIILDPHVAERSHEFDKRIREDHQSFFAAERDILGFDHAEIMSRACRLWRFPEPQVIAIRHHHDPLCPDANPLAYVIHLADILVISAGFRSGRAVAPNEIASQVMDFLDVQKDELDTIAGAVINDVQKIEKEFDRN